MAVRAMGVVFWVSAFCPWHAAHAAEHTYPSRGSDPLVGHHPGVSRRSSVLMGMFTPCDATLAGTKNAINPTTKYTITIEADFTEDPSGLSNGGPAAPEHAPATGSPAAATHLITLHYYIGDVHPKLHVKVVVILSRPAGAAKR